MANEHTLIIETQIPISMTCANATGIEKGTLLVMSDPFTVAAASAAQSIVGGVAATEKIASDGKTKIAVYRAGYFKGTASGSITVGDALVIAGATTNNLLQTASVNSEQIVGIALETCTDAETFLYELKPMVANLA